MRARNHQTDQTDSGKERRKKPTKFSLDNGKAAQKSSCKRQNVTLGHMTLRARLQAGVGAVCFWEHFNENPAFIGLLAIRSFKIKCI